MFRIAVLFVLPAVASAAPRELSHQGRLLDSAGVGLAGTVQLDLTIYRDAAGTDAVFSERFDRVSLEDGYFHVTLGAASTALEDDDLDGGMRWLGVAVDGGLDLVPRTPLASVPYALHADRVRRAVAVDAGTPCDAAHLGALEYDSSTLALQLCDGVQWMHLAVATPPPAHWVDSTYGYRQFVSISGSPGAGAGYVVSIDIGRSAADGGDVHLDGHAIDYPAAEGDGGDLAFFSADGVPLPFWVESVAANRARVWVRVSDSLDTDRTIQMYYGRSGAPNLADGDATFDLFDTFDGTSLDTSKWVPRNNVSVSGGLVTIGGNDSVFDGLASAQEFGVNHQVTWRGEINDEDLSFVRDGFGENSQGVSFRSSWNSGSVQTVVHDTASNSQNYVNTSIPLSPAVTRTFHIERTSDGNARFFIDGAAQTAPPGSWMNESPVDFQCRTGFDRVQVVFVSRVADVEPVVTGSAGEESYRP